MALNAFLASTSTDLFFGCGISGSRFIARLMDAAWNPVSSDRALLVRSLLRYCSSKFGGILFIRLMGVDCNLFCVIGCIWVECCNRKFEKSDLVGEGA